MKQATTARDNLLDAAVALFRQRGYAGTSVDELCAAAGVTKGAFFYHFSSKEALAVASADYWTQSANRAFGAAAYHAHEDPLDRILAYLDHRKAMVAGELADITCLAGTMVQETFASHPSIARACETSIRNHAASLEADIDEAMVRYRAVGGWTAQSLALHTQAVLQGAFILAKATGQTAVAAESIDHLKRYVELLFGVGRSETAGAAIRPQAARE